MSGCVVLDAGALVALERSDRYLWSALSAWSLGEVAVLVPSAALAQAWRGTARQSPLAAAMQRCAVASFDEIAHDIGVLLGRTRTRDVCDAQVALVAAAHADAVYTSDPADIRRLIDAIGGRRPTIVAC